MKKLIFTLTILALCYVNLDAQTPFRQTIRGHVVDKDSKTPIPRVSVSLQNTALSTITDAEGTFRLIDAPIGRQSLYLSFVGYKPQTISNLVITSGQETVLEVELEENVIMMKEVTISAINKQSTNNKMASVSARSFSVEETEKYAGSRGDVARMAMNFAGVSGANDARNDIVIRGNSPAGLLWKLEDIDIPNPNHFAENGTTGGPVCMLNNNLLANSDFFSSAFPAEYGNATSGVFDLKMRNGNNEKYEFLAQCGFNGFEFGAEGPFSKNYKGSFLINARYSTLEAIDINYGTSGVPKYKDISYKLNFPIKRGRITVFGLGGFSSIAMLDSKKTENDLYNNDNQDLYNRSKMGTSGISLTQFVNDKTYFKITVSALYSDGGTIIDTLDQSYNPHQYLDHNYGDFRATLNGFVHKKYNSQLSTKTGFTFDRLGYDLYTKKYQNDEKAVVPVIVEGKSLYKGPNLFRAYYEASYKFTDDLVIKPGIHATYFSLNNKYAVEPRIGASWELISGQHLSAGYGLHSQIQSMATYFRGTRLSDGSLIETNTNLNFTRSQQIVVGYDLSISENMRLKTEAYYQYLFDVPVKNYPSSYSMLNTGAGWGIGATDSMVNKGTGENLGLELTLERFFANNYYFLTTLSLYDSKYKGSDGIVHNTAFNGNIVYNLLFGREFPINDHSAFFTDLKTTFAGGRRYTEIDLVASQRSGDTEYKENEAFAKKFDPFFKADVKIGYRLNGPRVTNEWLFYVENVTNHQNPYMQSYNRSQNKIETTYQLGIFPMMQWRMRF